MTEKSEFVQVGEELFRQLKGEFNTHEKRLAALAVAESLVNRSAGMQDMLKGNHLAGDNSE